MEKMIVCPSCHLHARAHERECPHCGAPMRSPAGRVAPTSVAVLMGLSLIGCGNGGIDSNAVYGVPATDSVSTGTSAPGSTSSTTAGTEGGSSTTAGPGTTSTGSSSGSTTGDTETTGGTETTGDTDPTAGTAGSTTALYGSPALP